MGDVTFSFSTRKYDITTPNLYEKDLEENSQLSQDLMSTERYITIKLPYALDKKNKAANDSSIRSWKIIVSLKNGTEMPYNLEDLAKTLDDVEKLSLFPLDLLKKSNVEAKDVASIRFESKDLIYSGETGTSMYQNGALDLYGINITTKNQFQIPAVPLTDDFRLGIIDPFVNIGWGTRSDNLTTVQTSYGANVLRLNFENPVVDFNFVPGVSFDYTAQTYQQDANKAFTALFFPPKPDDKDENGNYLAAGYFYNWDIMGHLGMNFDFYRAFDKDNPRSKFISTGLNVTLGGTGLRSTTEKPSFAFGLDGHLDLWGWWKNSGYLGRISGGFLLDTSKDYNNDSIKEASFSIQSPDLVFSWSDPSTAIDGFNPSYLDVGLNFGLDYHYWREDHKKQLTFDIGGFFKNKRYSGVNVLNYIIPRISIGGGWTDTTPKGYFVAGAEWAFKF